MMIKELKIIENLLLELLGHSISNLIEDKESKDYFGIRFEVNKLKFIFRKSKISPKKVGQFVTLWKRNSNNETEPFNETDDFDFCIILSNEIGKNGFFLFPKNELIKRHILSTKMKVGKRGFRVYPKWTLTENKQAEITQNWQIIFFLDFAIESAELYNHLLEIITVNDSII